MGRLIGIDYGAKRTGLAVTDPEQRIAGVLTTVLSYQLLEFLSQYIQKESIEGFVIGLPQRMNAQPSESAPLVKAFAKSLAKRFPDIPIHWMDERFTSTMAVQSMIRGGSKKSDRQKKENIDAVSAAIILESFLQQEMIKKERNS